MNSIKRSPHFVVSLDKSLNCVLQDDQMDIEITFWDESENLARAGYFDYTFLKIPNAENLIQELNSPLSELSLKKLLQLCMKASSKSWNNQHAESKIPRLLGIGSCRLHLIYPGFCTGGEATPCTIINLQYLKKY